MAKSTKDEMIYEIFGLSPEICDKIDGIVDEANENSVAWNDMIDYIGRRTDLTDSETMFAIFLIGRMYGLEEAV